MFLLFIRFLCFATLHPRSQYSKEDLVSYKPLLYREDPCIKVCFFSQIIPVTDCTIWIGIQLLVVLASLNQTSRVMVSI